MKNYQFKTIIKASHIGKGGAYIEFPYSVEKEFGTKGRVSVVAFFDGIEYRGSLVKMRTTCHCIGITKQIRDAINKNIGDEIEVVIYKDTAERSVEIHPLLNDYFKEHKDAYINYDKHSYTNKKEINNLLNSAKKPETLQKRLQQIINSLT